MKKLKKIFCIIISVLLIGIMLVSGILFLKDKKQDKDEEKVFEELTNIVDENSEKQDNNRDYSKLFNMNEDMIAWIKIEGTTLDYPVMQSKDRPNFYLRKNFYKKYSYYGTPFLQETCDINTSDNLIIYGHHINNTKMFGILEKYKNKTFYNEHNIIEFITKEKNYKYQIVYTLKTSATNGFKYYEYYNFEDESKFNVFNDKCKELAFYNTNNLINFGDKLITLSTCDYSISNGRMVVVAKRI